ncbi:nuclear cohesin complex subunit [Arthroderma uncinatum]|uniref:nuclear cohesin complex subunit n=1 Tax=Arthroderma uncinatum TaxID=74035 RepID=UPI00144A8715|nr:nuclear cohesin complex subunit [Arthroderma uncinatum]KAF3482258.1 nuclear cohesin complex subunit [Arthroderma uncinatum]
MEAADDRDSSPLSEAGSGLAGQEDNGLSRRQSGRVRRKPEIFSSQTFNSSRPKRKRQSAANEDEDDALNDTSDQAREEDEEDDEQDGETDASEGEADEEELRERRQGRNRAAAGKKQQNQSRKPKAKPAAKKQKIANGISTELALRPIMNGQKPKPQSRKKKPRMRQSELGDEDGLYAEVFGRGHTTEAVAAEWLTKYEENNINGMRDLINFILRCSGTDIKVESTDIEDVDNVANRLNDIQEEYQAQDITDYPLVSKARNFKSFQSVLTSFFDDLIRTIHSASTLYTDPALIENIQVWITSMSSAPIRPFRHTATIVSLTIMTTLCHIAREVSSSVSNTRTQLETERKKKTTNKGRISALQTKIQEGQKRLETIDEILRDSFDTVFVHRYRDVDPKIRQECMGLLGLWIGLYKDMFFDGQYLRYLGWVLSDTVAATRSVVVHQLQKLFQNKDNIPGLRAFTERFRPRIVEMAVRDAEPGVRAATVELLDVIRDAGLLEPDDIDSIGRLIFDTEPRVRKAAGKFFVANIADVYESSIESMEEEVNEFFGEEDDENFDSPNRSWIKFKCLVDMLQVYDSQESELHDGNEQPPSRSAPFGSPIGSRFVLATESIYPHFKDFEHWESLAGYLLYDHSQILEPSDDSDPTDAIKYLYKLNEGQETILLEVLECAVKLHIQAVSKSDVDKKGRKTKQSVQMMEERLESIAHNLSQIIPRLLNKFGAVPEAASPVLRLEHLVNLDLIQDLQKDAAAYSDLMNNINQQFLTHSDQEVLAEATVAFLRARNSDELKEAMEGKIQELWDDTIDSLSSILADKKGPEVMSLSLGSLKTLSNTVMRISNLASISDCTSTLEAVPRSTSKKRSGRAEAPVDLLLSLAKRGLREEDDDEDVNKLEQEIATNTFKTLLVYFMWKIQSLTAALSSGSNKGAYNAGYFESLSQRRESFVATLCALMQAHGSGIKQVKLAATTTLLDLQTAFGTLRHAGPPGKNLTAMTENELAFQVQELPQEITPEIRSLLSRLHDTAERTFAKKSKRKLDLAADAEPLESESEVELDSDNDEDGSDADENEDDVKRATLLAEQRLCEITGKIVLAIIGRVLDVSGPQAGKLQRKLLRNKSRLGQNYKEVISYLEDSQKEGRTVRRRVVSKGKEPEGHDAAGANGAASNTRNGKVKSTEMVEDEDDDEDEEEEEAAVGEEDDEENLRVRGLVEDEEEQQDASDGEEREEASPTPDDDIMGD